MRCSLICRQLLVGLVFFAVLFALLALGFWQYGRYCDKKAWLGELAAASQGPALGAENLRHRQAPAFHTLRLKGAWQAQDTILLAGQFRHSRSGYSVITPLQWAPLEPWVLVDRGWVASPDGRTPPRITSQAGTQWVTGTVYRPVGKRFTLGPWQLSKQPVPVIQDWEFEKIAALLGHPVLPFVLRLSPQAASAYERNWSWTVMPPSRHLGYMLQWWAFAVVWLVGWWVLLRRKRKKGARR